MGRHHRVAIAVLAAVVAAPPAAAQDFQGRRASLFDLGIYGGGAYTSDWFTTGDEPTDPSAPPGLFGTTAGFWTGFDVGARQSEIFLPGAGTVRRGGLEVHILGPGTTRVTGAQGRFAFSFKPPDTIAPTPASRFYFSYSYFEGAGDRFGRVDPNTDNVAFTLDRVFGFPGGGSTTGLFGGTLGMNARQSFDISEHRVESGLTVPIPTGPGTLILKAGGTLLFGEQNYQSQLSLVTLPNVTMTEFRDTNQQLFGPTLGAAFQVPVTLGGDPSAPPFLFVTVGGEITPLFGQTSFHSSQVIDCAICGPNFPVTVASSASISEPFIEASAFLRGAVRVGSRGLVFAEVGVTSTERGAILTPANPNEQPLRHEIQNMIDTYVRAGLAFGL
jgi:hypothetical protein